MDSGGQAPPRRRATAMALLILLVLALHAWGLRTLYGLAIKDQAAETLDIPMFVRSIELPPPPPQLSPQAEPEAPAPATRQAPVARAAPVAAPAPSDTKQLDPNAAPPPEPAASSLPLAEPAASAPADTPPAPDALAVQASAPPPAPTAQIPELMSDATAAIDTGGTIVGMPVYDAKLPPSATWRYRLQRGLLSGEAQLQWLLQPDGSYNLLLEGTVAGINALSWRSAGTSSPYGASPTRFTVQRRNRGEQAANFNTESREITFSSSTNRLPWVNGVQDRLSWMVQLPAIVQADPARFKAGETVLLMVVGAGGGAELWQFAVEGEDSVDGVPALKLLRKPGKPYGTKAQVWLDPARGHMPLRAILTQGEDGNPLQLDLLP
jgi:hypothetical protein